MLFAGRGAKLLDLLIRRSQHPQVERFSGSDKRSGERPGPLAHRRLQGDSVRPVQVHPDRRAALPTAGVGQDLGEGGVAAGDQPTAAASRTIVTRSRPGGSHVHQRLDPSQAGAQLLGRGTAREAGDLLPRKLPGHYRRPPTHNQTAPCPTV